ncbi:MAG: hypothetical protein E7419_08275 [Ruminococcaceae bacterium]|nr:hypothetical protein [Oscillospiraceae bacterium]
MEWISNIIKFLKLPIKIILPTAWIFSCSLIFLEEKLLKKIGVLEWKNENGFVIGIIFLITSCLIIIYIAYFIKEKFSNLCFRLSRDRRTFKIFMDMNDTEQAIIIKMYNSQGYTTTLDYSQPLTQGLLARGFIYAGGQQLVSIDIRTNTIPTRFTLQPFVYKALDNYKPKLDNLIKKLTKKLSKAKTDKKKENITEQLTNCKEYYEVIYNGGF